MIVCIFYDDVLFRNSESELEGSQNLGRLQPDIDKYLNMMFCGFSLRGFFNKSSCVLDFV